MFVDQPPLGGWEGSVVGGGVVDDGGFEVVVGGGELGFGFEVVVVGRGGGGGSFGEPGSSVVSSSSSAGASVVVVVVVVEVVVDVVDDGADDEVVVVVLSVVVSRTSMVSLVRSGCASPVWPPASMATVANAVDTTTPATPSARYGVRRSAPPSSVGGASSIRSSGPSIPEALLESLRDRSVTAGSASQRGNLAALPNATSDEQESHVPWLTHTSG